LSAIKLDKSVEWQFIYELKWGVLDDVKFT
jgi:hypothetical protein